MVGVELLSFVVKCCRGMSGLSCVDRDTCRDCRALPVPCRSHVKALSGSAVGLSNRNRGSIPYMVVSKKP